MKTIGIIGGMSWESTVTYYQLINRAVQRRLGGLASAKIVLVSVDFSEIEPLQRCDDWDTAGALLAESARQVQRGGADLLLLATNTMHIVFEQIQAAVSIPMLHIADGTAEAVRAAGLRRVGLLGTRFTMEQDFYRARLQSAGLEVLTPDASGRELVHRVIYAELVRGTIREESRQGYREVMAELVQAGAEGIILGCTEIGLLVDETDAPVPLFDTTALHAAAAVEMALG